MPLSPQQIAEIKRRALAKGISEQEVDLAMPQLVKDFDAKMQGSTIDTSQAKAPTPTTEVSVLPPKDEGNIITRTVKGLTQNAVDYGKFVGESVAQATRVGSEALDRATGGSSTSIFGADDINKEVGQLALQDRQILAQMKAETDPEKKKALAVQSREINDKIDTLGNQARDIGSKKTTFLMDEQKIKDRGDILMTGAKATAGAMSYAIPGSLGVGGTVAGTIGRVAGAGAISGGLQGFGSSESGKELDSTITGAVVGGVTSGVLSAAGQALKAVRESRVNSDIGKKIANAGTDFKKSAYVKAAGRKPIIREGGDKLIDNMMKAGIKPGSPDELIHQADDILMDNAGVIFDKADEFKQRGVVIDKESVLAPLQAKLNNAPAKSKPVIEKVINFVKADLDRFDEFTPAEAYAMKGDYGPFGNWTSTMDADAVTEANLWEEVYTNLNGLMDESFKKGGYEDFRKVNEVVSTAINAKKYAQRSGNVAPNLNTLGLMDVLYGAGGMGLTGGVGGVIGGVVIKKAINAPRTATVIGNTLEELGKKLGQEGSQVGTQTAGSTIAGQAASRALERTAVDASLLDNTKDLQGKYNNSNNYESDNKVKNELNQATSPIDINNEVIISQPTFTHPDPRFKRYKSKEEMVADAFAQGYSPKTIAILKRDWDENAPKEQGTGITPEVQSLIDQRTTLTKAGLSTKTVDAKLSRYGYSVNTSTVGTEKERMFNNAGTAAQDALTLLNSGHVKTGLGQGTLGSIGEKLDLNTEDQQKYRSSLALARTAARNALLGANMTAGEMESIQAFIPEFNDGPSVAKKKLETFIELMNKFSGLVPRDSQ